MNQLLLLRKNNVKETMSKSKLNRASFYSKNFIKLLESKMNKKVIESYNCQSIQIMQLKLNNLEKRIERNLWTNSLKSNNPIFDKRSCIP